MATVLTISVTGPGGQQISESLTAADDAKSQEVLRLVAVAEGLAPDAPPRQMLQANLARVRRELVGAAQQQRRAELDAAAQAEVRGLELG